MPPWIDVKAELDARRALFDAETDAITLCDGTRIVAVNKAGQLLFRCSEAEVLAHPPDRWSPPRQPNGRNSAELTRELVAKVVAGEPQVFEWRHRRWDGEEFDAEVSIRSMSVAGRLLLRRVAREILISPSLLNRHRALRAPPPDARAVLLVDDEVALLSVAERTLRRTGFEVITARDGREAILKFDAHADQIGVVVLDVVMPVMSGHEAFALIKRKCPTMPVIITSGYLDAKESTQRLIGEAPFLPKPYTPALLVSAIHQALRAPSRLR